MKLVIKDMEVDQRERRRLTSPNSDKMTKEKPLTTKKERGGARREKKVNVKKNMVEALKGR